MRKLLLFMASLLVSTAAIAQGSLPDTSLPGSAGVYGSHSARGFGAIAVADGACSPRTLTVGEWWPGTLAILGSLTADCNVVPPAQDGQDYGVVNLTTGGHNVVIGAGGAAQVTVPPSTVGLEVRYIPGYGYLAFGAASAAGVVIRNVTMGDADYTLTPTERQGTFIAISSGTTQLSAERKVYIDTPVGLPVMVINSTVGPATIIDACGPSGDCTQISAGQLSQVVWTGSAMVPTNNLQDLNMLYVENLYVGNPQGFNTLQFVKGNGTTTIDGLNVIVGGGTGHLSETFSDADIGGSLHLNQTVSPAVGDTCIYPGEWWLAHNASAYVCTFPAGQNSGTWGLATTGGGVAGTIADLTSSRSFGTVYTNPGAHALIVSGWGTTSGSGTGNVTCNVGSMSSTLISAYANSATATVDGGQDGFTCFVPAGYAYQVTVTGAVNGLGKWTESVMQ